MFEAMGLKITTSRSSWMASPAYKISEKICHSVQNLLVEDWETQTGDWISLLSFLESRLKITFYHHATPRETVICDSDGVTSDCVLHQL
jgi:hypothetical protein